MKNIQKRSVIAAIVVCAGAAIMAGVVSKQPVKETTFPLQAEEPGTEGKQPDVKTDAYDLADTDLTVWYEDPSYEDFFEYAARQYFEQTGVKAAFKCQDTLDYIGMIYDNTMQGEDYPDVYLLNGDELEEAYLYGLAMENEDGGSYEGSSPKSVKASTYEDKMIGYPLSYDANVFVYQNGYFENQPESLQAIIDYSNENEPGENVEYLLEWDVNDAFYDFPFVGNSVTFEKTAPETMNVAYDEDLYQKDLEYFETILGSFSLDINSVSMDSILEHFKAGKTLCAFVNTDSLQKLDDISYSVMEIPALNEELPSIGCASTDMFVVNDFSKNTDQAADFADFVTVRLADRLHDMSGHYSVFLSQTADDVEKTAYQAYEDAVLLPDSQDAKDFWVGLKEKIAEYF